LLAMDLRTPRGIRFAASSLTTIASRLAPTGDHIRLSEQQKFPQEYIQALMRHADERPGWRFE